MDPSVWDEVWNRIHPVFTETAKAIRKTNPGVRVHSAREGNERSPFWAYLSVLRSDDPGADEIAITLTADLSDDRLTVHADIMWGQGPILAELPPVDLPISDLSREAILSYAKEVERFVRVEALSKIRQALAS